MGLWIPSLFSSLQSSQFVLPPFLFLSSSSSCSSQPFLIIPIFKTNKKKNTEGNAPNSNSPFWYSFDYANVHVTVISTEHSTSLHSAQYAWINDDLALASRSASTEWIVVMGHKPMYSSSIVHGSDVSMRNDLEPLFRKYGVDVCVWGHVHNVERSAHVYNGTIVKPSFWTGKTNAPVHFVVGTGGRGLYTEFEDPQPEWSRFRRAVFGYSRFTFFRNSSFHYQFLESNGNNQTASTSSVTDEFWIHKGGNSNLQIFIPLLFIFGLVLVLVILLIQSIRDKSLKTLLPFISKQSNGFSKM